MLVRPDGAHNLGDALLMGTFSIGPTGGGNNRAQK